MNILIISNPVSGNKTGPQFVEENVLPLLKNANYSYQLEECEAPGVAGSLAVKFLQKHTNVTLILSGGDGTIHEVVNGLMHEKTTGVVQLVICPQGTANALYSTLFPPSDDELLTVKYRLKSLYAFLDGRSRPLTLTQTHLLTSNGQITETVVGVVVTSTALHASILDTAESLRATISGIERFKVAAAQSISNWYGCHVRLYALAPAAPVQIYDPSIEAFKPLGLSDQPYVDLSGPFEYFLSTVNVDRLEPAFETSPLFTNLPPMPGEMDLIVVRPLRSPVLESDNRESRAAFVQISSAVLQGVYNRGSHISLRYAADGIVLPEGNGPLVVEYIRCGGWEWIPNESDAGAHLVCIDGTVLKLQSGGKATCRVLSDTANMQFTVCA